MGGWRRDEAASSDGLCPPAALGSVALLAALSLPAR